MSSTCRAENSELREVRRGGPGLILVPFRSSVAMMMHSDNVGHNKIFVFCDRNALFFFIVICGACFLFGWFEPLKRI